MSVSQYPDPNHDTGSQAVLAQPGVVAQPVQPPANIVVQWLVYQVTQKDAARHTASTGNPPFSIAVSDVDGNDYQELLTNLTSLYGMEMLDEGQLLVVYTKDYLKSASLLDLAKRSITTTQPIVDLGGGVQ